MKNVFVVIYIRVDLFCVTASEVQSAQVHAEFVRIQPPAEGGLNMCNSHCEPYQKHLSF